MTQEVLYDVRDGIAWLTINRPEARNAMNKAVRDGIREHAQAFADDPAAQVLVITATGDKAFSAGGDLKEMADVQMRIPPRDLFVYFNRSLTTDKPIIAAVNGIAYAGGSSWRRCATSSFPPITQPSPSQKPKWAVARPGLPRWPG